MKEYEVFVSFKNTHHCGIQTNVKPIKFSKIVTHFPLGLNDKIGSDSSSVVILLLFLVTIVIWTSNLIISVLRKKSERYFFQASPSLWPMLAKIVVEDCDHGQNFNENW